MCGPSASNNTRQGWNEFEIVLTPANVPRLKKLREFSVDEKIDVSPLVVGDKLYVCSMSNTVFVFDVSTGAELVRRQLAIPFDPPPRSRPDGSWKLYHSWGITATPVIDVLTNTIYVTTFGKPKVDSQDTERNNMLFVLDAGTLADKAPPVLIAGDADNGGTIANGFTTPYQKLRAGLGLLTEASGMKAVIVSFSINGENPRGPGHGFVVAYDVRGLNREAGFTPAPAIWNVTPGGGAGGVWMSGSGPAIDGNDIYLATGNGMDPGTMADNFGESFVRCVIPPVSRLSTTANQSSSWPTSGAPSATSVGRTRIRISAPPACSLFLSEATSSAVARTEFSTTSTRTTWARTAGILSSIFLSSPHTCRIRRTARRDCLRPHSRSELADRESRSQPADADADGQDVPHPRHAGVHGRLNRRVRLHLG